MIRKGAVQTIAKTYLVGSPPVIDTGVIASGINEASKGMIKTNRSSLLLLDEPSRRNSARVGTIVAHVLR